MVSKKVFVVFVFVIYFCGILEAKEFQCYSCFNAPCNETTKVTCTEETVKEGLLKLAPYYSFDSSSLKPPFQLECLKLDTIFASKEIVLGQTATESVFFKGCAVKQIDVCQLNVSVFFGSEIDKSCNICTGNLCNGSSAVNFSVVLISIGFILKLIVLVDW